MSISFDAVARWWQNWTFARSNIGRLDRCGAAEVEHIARDVGIGAPELRALAGRWPDAAEPLNRRLAALALDPAVIRRIEPQVLHDLQRVCSLCRMAANASTISPSARSTRPGASIARTR